MTKGMAWAGALAVVAAMAGCVRAPQGIVPVDRFDVDRYLGKWYEIARLDHSFERGLTHVNAMYSLSDNGKTVKVVNRGYDPATKQWRQAEGRAKFVGKHDKGFLNVAFFGPFYGSYVVFELDHEGYEYALVTGPSRSYLWILSRTPTIDPALKDRLVETAKQNGFAVEGLIFVDQSVAATQPSDVASAD